MLEDQNSTVQNRNFGITFLRGGLDRLDRDGPVIAESRATRRVMRLNMAYIHAYTL